VGLGRFHKDLQVRNSNKMDYRVPSPSSTSLKSHAGSHLVAHQEPVLSELEHRYSLLSLMVFLLCDAFVQVKCELGFVLVA
jgi:hypothetical protein